VRARRPHAHDAHRILRDLANSDTNRSSSFGRTGNAYDVRFSPGGSSGGTVTAVEDSNPGSGTISGTTAGSVSSTGTIDGGALCHQTLPELTFSGTKAGG